VLAASCLGGVRGLSSDEPPDYAAAPEACLVDADCILVAESCCECPTVAIHVAVDKGCPAIDCDQDVPPVCPAREARCQDSQCVIACQRQECAETCADGYAIDDAGCLTCACAAPASECTIDGECTRTRADCCGCASGGFDTAVPNVGLSGYEEMLMCEPNPACPGGMQPACTADIAPTCVQGRCELIAPEPPVGACGRADLPPCPAGSVCVINDDPRASVHGLGICSTPPPGP
jgi:hypothetical protein